MQIMKLLLYCTKAKPYLLHMPKDDEEFKKGIEFSLTSGKEFKEAYLDINDYKLNGKIVAECDFEVEEIEYEEMFVDIFDENEEIVGTDIDKEYDTKALYSIDLQDKSCLSFGELDNYLKGKKGYAIHIENLHIFDEPRKLNEYVKYNQNDEIVKLNKAPNNMMFVYECIGVPMYDECHFCGYDEIWNDYIIIPVSSQEMCRIANKGQTVLVRRNVLKEMK